MLAKIVQTLKGRGDLMDWSVRQVISRGHQLFDIHRSREAYRVVDEKYFVVEVLKKTTDEQGKPGCGTGHVTLLPADHIGSAIDEATLGAGLVHNPPYRMAEPAPIPEVPLHDETLASDAQGALTELSDTFQSAISDFPQIVRSAAEFFVEERQTQMINSRGLDAQQRETSVYLEWALIAGANGHKAESFHSLSRRRMADLDLVRDVARHAGYAGDLLAADAPPEYAGPVVLQGELLATFMNANTLKYLASAESRYNNETTWTVGNTISAHEVKGDPLTLWANRRLPYGTNSDRIDKDGLPARRHLLVENHRLASYTGDQQYAHYLSMDASGAFGNVEVAAGPTPAQELMAEPHIEIVAFSWFIPNVLTGDFASEIRQGYIVNGEKRTAFKGGMLVGNLLQCLSRVRWSSETGYFGDYQGPAAAKFEDLTITAGQ